MLHTRFYSIQAEQKKLSVAVDFEFFRSGLERVPRLWPHQVHEAESVQTKKFSFTAQKTRRKGGHLGQIRAEMEIHKTEQSIADGLGPLLGFEARGS